MKKIIGTAVLAVLAAGAVFAEPKITLNVRTRANLYKQSKDIAGKKSTSTFALDKTSETVNNAWNEDKDCFVTSVTTDYAGVVLDIDPNNNDGSIAIDSYYGWLNFRALKFTTGTFSSRYTDRMNVSRLENINLTDSDTAKFGISNLVAMGGSTKETTTYAFNTKTGVADSTVTTAYNISSGKTIGYDADNISSLSGKTPVSMFVDYTFSDLPGKLLVKAGLIKNEYKKDESSTDDKKYQEAGYAFEAAYEAENFALDGILKLPTEKSLVGGIYATLGMIPNAKATLGFTYAKDDAETGDKCGPAKIFDKTTKWNAFAIDARLSYNVNDATQVILQGKFTSIKPDQKIDNNKDDAQTALEVVGEVSYVVNDLVAVALDGGIYMCDLDDNDDGKWGENYFKVVPAVQFTAGKGATLSAGLSYQKALNTDKDFGAADSVLSIPCVLRVKL